MPVTMPSALLVSHFILTQSLDSAMQLGRLFINSSLACGLLTKPYAWHGGGGGGAPPGEAASYYNWNKNTTHFLNSTSWCRAGLCSPGGGTFFQFA